MLIDRGTDKILCKEAMIDDGVLILKQDGTNNQFFVLANENIIPDLDVRKYLLNLRRKKLSLNVRKLSDGRLIEISQNSNGYVGTGSFVSIDAKSIDDGKYKLATSSKYIVVGENVILNVLTEEIHTNPDGKDIIIQYHDNEGPKKGDFVFIDGVQIKDGIINFSKRKNILVKDGKIVRFESENSARRTILHVLLGIVILLMVVAIIVYIIQYNIAASVVV